MVALPIYDFCQTEKRYWTQFCLNQYHISSSCKLYVRPAMIQYLFKVMLNISFYVIYLSVNNLRSINEFISSGLIHVLNNTYMT